MLAKHIRLKRGTTSSVLSYTPLLGEPVWDSDTNRLYVGDGSTPGGIEIGRWVPGITLPKYYYSDSDSPVTANAPAMVSVDTSGGPVTIRLPSDHQIGDEVRIIDENGTFSTNNCTVELESPTDYLNGVQGADVVLNIDNGTYVFYFGNDGANDGWFSFDVSGFNWYNKGVRGQWSVHYGEGTLSPAVQDLWLIETATGTSDITLPQDPQLGDRVRIEDYGNNASNNNITVTPFAGDNISGSVTPLPLTEDGIVVTFTWNILDDNSHGWIPIVGRDDGAAQGGTFEGLADTPSGYGSSGYVLQTNGLDSVTFIDPSTLITIPASHTHVVADITDFSTEVATLIGSTPPQSHTHVVADITDFSSNIEAPLGNPPVDGYLLESTAAGARSWVDPSTLGGGSGNGNLLVYTIDVTDWSGNAWTIPAGWSVAKAEIGDTAIVVTHTVGADPVLWESLNTTISPNRFLVPSTIRAFDLTSSGSEFKIYNVSPTNEFKIYVGFIA